VPAKLAGLRIVAATSSVVNFSALQNFWRLPVLPVAVFLLYGSLLSGCANGTKKASWEQDKPLINTVIRDVMDSQNQSREQNQSQDAGIATLKTRVDVLDELANQYQLQQAQIQALSDQLDQLRHVKKSKPVKKPSRSTSRPKPSQPHRTTAIVAPTPAPQPVASVVDTAAQLEAEKNAYTAAYLALKSGRFEEATTGFSGQLEHFPKGEYADQALYWLGETYLAQGKQTDAQHAFMKITDHYADSAKHAAALFKLAQISAANKQMSKASDYYRRLIKAHADSTMAEQARTALKELEQTESGK